MDAKIVAAPPIRAATFPPVAFVQVETFESELLFLHKCGENCGVWKTHCDISRSFLQLGNGSARNVNSNNVFGADVRSYYCPPLACQQIPKCQESDISPFPLQVEIPEVFFRRISITDVK